MRFLSSIFSDPELDGYSDEELAKLTWQAKVRRADAIWVIPLAVGIVAGIAWLVAAAAITQGMNSTGTILTGIAFGRWAALNGVVALTIAGAAGALVRWRMLVTSIKRIVNKAGCPYCEFSLVGLPVKSGWVQCPECGQRVYLFEHKLTPEDLVPESARFGAGTGAGPMGAYKEPPAASRPRRR